MIKSTSVNIGQHRSTFSPENLDPDIAACRDLLIGKGLFEINKHMFYICILTCLSRCARKLFIDEGTHSTVFKKNDFSKK